MSKSKDKEFEVYLEEPLPSRKKSRIDWDARFKKMIVQGMTYCIAEFTNVSSAGFFKRKLSKQYKDYIFTACSFSKEKRSKLYAKKKA